MLDRERPRLTTALTKLGQFSDTANRLVNDTQADLVTNLTNLAPTIKALADVGPDLDAALAYATVFPYGQGVIDRGIRGDFINIFVTVDISGPRLRKSLFLGTRGGQEGRDLVPLPGEPYFQTYTLDPLGRPLRPPPSGGPLGPLPGNPPTPVCRPIRPGRTRACRDPGRFRHPRRRHPRPQRPRRQHPRHHRPRRRRPRHHRLRRRAATDADPFHQDPIGDIHRGVGRRPVGDGDLLHAGTHAAWHREAHGDARVAEQRWPLPAQQRHLPRCADRQGHRCAVGPDGAVATLSIATSPQIPADLEASVKSVSAVGEQYVDLMPRTDSGPYLQDHAVITRDNATIPMPIGPVLDKVNTLVGTFPKDRLADLLDETYKGLNGAGEDFGSLLDSGSVLSADLNGVAAQSRALADDARPLLEGQAQGPMRYGRGHAVSRA